ncbi:MAG TPA: hypothetical protein VLR89_10500 [Anaerolineaceae bacterium]|nr:hypothetical protein [Anaerolineaceae bacterium]
MKKRYLVYLAYLLLVTLTVTAVSLSRFSTTVQSSAQVSVARPVLNYVPQSLTLNGVAYTSSGNNLSLSDLKPGDSLVYKFDINNFEGGLMNQVKLQYRVSVFFDPATPTLPLTYTLVPDGSYPSAGSGYTYLGFGSAITHGYTLTVNWAAGELDPAYANKAQIIRIQVDSYQADN